MKHRHVPARCLVVLCLSACGPSDAPDGSAAVALGPEDVHVLATSDAIAVVQDLEVAADGSVWVFNSAPPYFIGFGPGGELLAAVGTAGDGPGEFRSPASFVTGNIDGQVWALDYARHAFVRISSPEADWMQLDIPRESVPPGSVMGGMDLMSPTVRTARLGSEVILPRTVASLESGVLSFVMAILVADLVALDPEAGSTRDVLSLREVLGDPLESFAATEGGFPLWRRLWAVCGDRLRVHDRLRNELRTFSATGQELEPVPLPPVELTEVSRSEFARAIFPLRQAEVVGAVGERLSPGDSARVMDEIVGEASGEPQELASYLPRYVDFRCSDAGVMWLQPVDLSGVGARGGPRWLRIAPSGEVREVQMPERFDPFRFVDGRIWGIQRDALDVATVAWVELPEGL